MDLSEIFLSLAIVHKFSDFIIRDAFFSSHFFLLRPFSPRNIFPLLVLAPVRNVYEKIWKIIRDLNSRQLPGRWIVLERMKTSVVE